MSYANLPPQIGSEEATSPRRTAITVKAEHASTQAASVEPVSETPSGASRDIVAEPMA